MVKEGSSDFMIKSVFINDTSFVFNITDVEDRVSEPTGNNLKFYRMQFEIRGIQALNDFETLIKEKSLILKIPDDNIILKCKVSNSVYSYTSNQQNEYTTYNYILELLEIDKDLPEEWNYNEALLEVILRNWIQTKALYEFLSEKEGLTEKIYMDKIDKIYKSDYENMRKMIISGIDDFNKK
jgi:hypothetical protein